MTHAAQNLSKPLKRFAIALLTPKEFNQDLRKALLANFAYVIEAFPTSYWDTFERLHILSNFLLRKVTASPPIQSDVYNHLKKNKLFTNYPLASAISAHLSGEFPAPIYAKYRSYQAIIIVCCFIRYTHDRYGAASGNRHALRELRLMATDHRHQKLICLMPDLTEALSLQQLSAKFKELKNKTHPKLQQYGLSYFELVIREALNWTSKRRPKFRVRDLPESDTIVEVKLADDFEEQGTRVEELCAKYHNPSSPQKQDECLVINAGRTVRLIDNAGNGRENRGTFPSRAIKAIQHKSLAEKLTTRQLSLNCSYNQLTEWDIHQLIRHSVDKIGRGIDVNNHAVLLICLFTGRDPEALLNQTKAFLLEHYKNHPCLRLSHSVPSSKQDKRLEICIKKPRNWIVLPLPKILRNHLLVECHSNSLKTHLREINAEHRCRLTLGRIVRYLDHWYTNNGIDRAEVALIRGSSLQRRPALSYTNFCVDTLTTNYRNYLEDIFDFAEMDPQLPPPRPVNTQLGSALHLPANVMHNFFRLLRNSIPLHCKPALKELASFHNHYVCYVWALLSFVTGHRDVNAPMGQLTDLNKFARSWWISDKEVRHGLAARIVTLPTTAVLQLEKYLDHLREIKNRTQLVNAELFKRCVTALNGTGNLLFFIELGANNTPIIEDLTPARLKIRLGDRLPWPANWGRHHLRSELKKIGVAPEEIDGWMGHEDIGEESLGRHSMLSTQYLTRIAGYIEQLLNTHQIEAIDGWKTR
ncbi:hypothetical protein ACFFLG_19215 [Shewanella indica]|uniref:hypothetical protein n=1 Tax=Shewanella indica TaxID=768528 RepID=UPI0016765B2F|nr:hypothetical protein [Shewanella indica]